MITVLTRTLAGAGRWVAAAVLLAGMAGTARADSISFDPTAGDARPDILIEYLTVAYDGSRFLTITGYFNSNGNYGTPILYRDGGTGGCPEATPCFFDDTSTFQLTYDRLHPGQGSSNYTLAGQLVDPPTGLEGPRTFSGTVGAVEVSFDDHTLKFLGTVTGSDATDFGFIPTGFIGMQLDLTPFAGEMPTVGGWFNPNQGSFMTGGGNMDYFAQATAGGQSLPVPEPSTLALLGIGVVALNRLRKRQG